MIRTDQKEVVGLLIGSKLEMVALANLPSAGFDMVNADSGSLYGWLFNLRKYGFAKLENGPVKSGSLMDVASLFGFVRETNYGKWFEVRTEVNPG